MRLPFHIIMLLAGIAVTVMACGDEGEPTADATVYDIVCLSEVNNGGSYYTLSKPESDRLITYYSNERIDTSRIRLRSRFMLAYRVPGGTPYVSGRIKPIGISLITNDTLRHGYIDKIEGWDRDPVYLLSSWMSQDYLNLRARLPYDTEPRTLAVMVDSLTLGREYPDCYLVHRLKEPVNTFERAYYISIDMSSLRELDNCRGFNLLLNNSNLTTDRYTFTLRDFK